MYEAFYGLGCKPFQLNPDPNFYYASKQHRRAKAYLEYGVQRNEGFIVITGEIGAGKTTVVRGLLDGIDASKVVTANLVTTQLDAEDTLRMVASAFGVRAKDVSKSELLMTLEAFLVSQTTQGKRCLLIVDEAQNLTARAVEELRMLSNFQLGQPGPAADLSGRAARIQRAILQSPGMQQLRQRVTATCHIGPLDQAETRGYIEHRLKCAGASPARPSFDARCLRRHSCGQRRHPAAHQPDRRPLVAVGFPEREGQLRAGGSERGGDASSTRKSMPKRSQAPADIPEQIEADIVQLSSANAADISEAKLRVPAATAQRHGGPD